MNVNEAITELCEILKKNYDKSYSRNTIFEPRPGRKYTKIVMIGEHSESAHAFVDKEGNLYKPATWAHPAKGVRFNLLKDMDVLKKNADWSGGYLYRQKEFM